MAIRIVIDEKKLADIEAFMQQIENSVHKAVKNSMEGYAKNVRRDWRKSSTENNVPGNFNAKWKEFKKTKGLRTEHLQRFGRGNKKSYYENVVVKAMKPDGYFVGVLQKSKAYDIDGKAKNKSLADVAKELEERFPLWQDIMQRSPQKLRKLLKKNLVEELRKIGAKDAK